MWHVVPILHSHTDKQAHHGSRNDHVRIHADAIHVGAKIRVDSGDQVLQD